LIGLLAAKIFTRSFPLLFVKPPVSILIKFLQNSDVLLHGTAWAAKTSGAAKASGTSRSKLGWGIKIGAILGRPAARPLPITRPLGRIGCGLGEDACCATNNKSYGDATEVGHLLFHHVFLFIFFNRSCGGVSHHTTIHGLKYIPYN
jgi:hypothetical protein